MSTVTAQPRTAALTPAPHVPSTGHGEYAVAETARLALQRDFLLDQLAMVSLQRRALAGAAAAHRVLERHPDAAVLEFAVRDGHAHQLAYVMDAEGRILPARRTGEWAESVLAEVKQEEAAELEGLAGFEVSAKRIRVDVAAALAAVLVRPGT